MKSFIYPEMMVHVPLCTSKTPHTILLISNAAELLAQEACRHTDMTVNTLACDLENLRDLGDASFDVVVCEMQGDAAVIAHINRILKADGQLCITHDSLENTHTNKVLMNLLGHYFKIIMPYHLGTGETALLASKEYHPTADIILQRSDMLDGLSYYNCDVHVASFAMPNYIRKEYLGSIKN